jgi:hypothetical protein
VGFSSGYIRIYTEVCNDSKNIFILKCACDYLFLHKRVTS